MILLYWAIRLFLGIIIAAGGLGKLLDVRGFADVIKTYQLKIPERLYMPIAVVVTFFELGLGLIILFGFGLQAATILSMAMNVGYMVLLVRTLLRGIKLKNCGCFGVFFARPLTWLSPLEDLAMIGLSYILFLLV